MNILKKRRKELQMTQQEMAKRLGVTQTTLSFYENRVHPKVSTDTLDRIATAYGLKPNTVLKHFKGE
jgi:transcriptional regulator with XRE-family HTH domain